MTIRDNLHLDLSADRGYQKPFNLIVSPREDGKSTTASNDLIRKAFLKDHSTSVIMVRNVNEISDAVIEKRMFEINKFYEPKIEVRYKVSDFDKGIVPVYDKATGLEIMRYIALKIKKRRLKDQLLAKPAFMIFDEFIIDTQTGEKYLDDEFGKFQELYNTLRRENPKLQAFFFGNPYSLFNPYFVAAGIDFTQLTKNKVMVAGEFLIDYHDIKPELKEKLLKENPLYKFDEDYIQYALEGNPLFDSQIRLSNQPNGFRLWNVISTNKKTIGIFKNTDYFNFDDLYYCSEIKNYSKERDVFVFDLNDLITDRILFSSEEKSRFAHFRSAFRSRQVLFKDIATYYMIESLYKLL